MYQKAIKTLERVKGDALVEYLVCLFPLLGRIRPVFLTTCLESSRRPTSSPSL
jgi:hypothetical protein